MYPAGFQQVASIEIPTDGNAVPYKRMTQMEARLAKKPEHKVSAKMLTKHRGIRRYLDWKTMIASSTTHLAFQRGPKEKVYLYVYVYFRDMRHGDPDNIFKGIADSIYVQDKYVAGCVDFGYDRDNPRVIITVLEREQEG